MTTVQDPLIVDAQVFQTTAWDRGMGKYSLHFLKALRSADNEREMVLLFSSKLALKKEVEEILQRAFPGVAFDFLDLDLPQGIPGTSLKSAQDANRATLDAYLHERYTSRVIFLILSLFIGEACPVFPTNAYALLIFYDLIPLQYPKLYGDAWSYTDYLERFSVLFRADAYLAISETVANDLAYFTGISSDAIHVIDGARVPRSSYSESRVQGVPDRFVLMTSGNDLRKNNQRAIQGFERYRQQTGDLECRLVVTSFFDEKTKSDLETLSSGVLFVGNVSEAELSWLYQHTQALLFVPEYEGLGLPVLEAIEAYSPVVCSDLRIFREEMSDEAFYLADPYDVENIALELTKAMKKVGFAEKLEAYKKIEKKYSWDNTARRALRCMEGKRRKNIVSKKRIAVFAPDPASYSAIGKVTMLAHDSLSQYADVDYYIERGRSSAYALDTFTRPSFLNYIAPVYDAAQFHARRYVRYDAVFYAIGNSEFHVETYKSASYLPGCVMFHDIVLDGLFENELLRFGHIDNKRLRAEATFDAELAVSDTKYVGGILAYQTGAIAYSKYATNALGKENLTATPIVTSHLPVALRHTLARKNTHGLRVGFAGIISASKGLSNVHAVAALKDVSIHIFGISLTDEALVDELKSIRRVTLETNVTDFEFSQKLSRLDVIVCYRSDYHGEASLTVLEAMAHGVVPVVRRIGWYDELPDDAVLKVDREADIIRTLETLQPGADALLQRKQACVDYVAKHASYYQFAQHMINWMNAVTNEDSTASIALRVREALREGQTEQDIEKLYEHFRDA